MRLDLWRFRPAWPSKQLWRNLRVKASLKFACCPMCVFCMGLFIHWRSGFCREKLLARWDKKANCRSIIFVRLSFCLSAPVRCWLAGTLVWNQRNSGCLTWFMTHSGLGLIRCTQAPLSNAACVWMTIEDQQHYTSDFPPAFWAPQITSSLLIYGGHLESHTDPSSSVPLRW